MTMKPEFMRLRRALAGIIAALLMAAGIVALSPALSASAHHNDVYVSASCDNFVWTITWKIVNSEADKAERITSSTDQSIIADDTVIDKGGTYTTSETVSGPVTKTLTISAVWTNGVTNNAAATIYPSDFTGTCVPMTPDIGLVIQPCNTGGSLGAVTANLSNLVVGSDYLLTLYSGADVALDTLSLKATATSHSMPFAGHGPGEYYVAVSDPEGSLLTLSAKATIADCATELTITVQLEPCVSPAPSVAEREISIEVDGLAPSTVYTVQLVTDDAAHAVIASTTTPGDNVATFAHTFTNVPSPGDYKIEVLGAPAPLVSDPITAPLCGLSTLAPPEIEMLVDQCDGVDPAQGAVSARVIELDATRTYYVRIVDGSGATVAGGSDRVVTGVTTATVDFPGITAPGTYTAQLLIDPGKQLAATSPNSVDLMVCLPTLAMTGPGVLVPLGSVAALLLTLGGAVVTGRLRRRMAL